MTQTSKEYAEALFELALQDACTERVTDALAVVEQVFAETPGYRALLGSPAVAREKRLALLDDAFRGKVPDIVLALLRMMVSRGHVNDVNGMITAYNDLAREHRGESIAYVTSAVALTGAEADALRDRLEKTFSRKVTLQCRRDPSLLGGVRVEIDGRVIDGSLKNKLQQIKEVMNA